MKKGLMLAAVVALTACSHPNRYVIEGNVAGLEGPAALQAGEELYRKIAEQLN